MTKKIRLTVLMSVYNGGKYLAESMSSILKQTFSEFEFIIINDGSTDNSVETITSFNDERIKLITQSNKGLAKALNLGLKESNGEFIARMDADDIAHPLRLEKELEFLSTNSDYVLVGSEANLIDESGKYVLTTNLPTGWDEIRSKLRSNPFIHSSVMFRKDVAISCGGYYEPIIHYFEDVVLWNRMAEYGKMANLNEPLVDYRILPGAITIKSKNNKVINVLLDQILTLGDLTQKEVDRFLNLKEKETPKLKVFYYHLYLSKKFLWNNYLPEYSREHSINAIKASPTQYYPYFLYFISFLPGLVIRFLYRLKKY